MDNKEGFMKKCFVLLAAILVVVSLVGCSSFVDALLAPVPEPTEAAPVSAVPSVPDLDTVIKDAAFSMEESIPEGTTIALVSVASSSAQLSDYILGRLEAAIVSGRRLVVVDRANLDRVREEQGFQYSGEVDDESAKEIGVLLGAGAIVTGSLSDLGDVFSLSLKAINMETATIAVSLMEDVARSARIETMLASGGGSSGSAAVASTASSETTAQAAAPAAPAAEPEVSYKVGDVGPAGGLIFYDKGNNQGGWRYMEAAPVETEITAIWGIDMYKMTFLPYNPDATNKPVGTGKTATQDIVSYAVKEGGGGFGWAAVECADLSVNGFDDWFLPSNDELNYMYGNLHRKGEGNFRNDIYWSSTGKSNGHGALFINFSSGAQNNDYSDRTHRVRAVRQF